MLNKDDLNVEIQTVQEAIKKNKSLRMHKKVAKTLKY